MKTTISIITWINRILMIPFLIGLLVLIFDNELFIYSLYIAFVLGIYQSSSFLITLFFIKKIGSRKVKEAVIYISIVILYFLIGYLIIDNFRNSNYKFFIQLFLIGAPIMLSIFWTYILESIKKEI